MRRKQNSVAEGAPKRMRQVLESTGLDFLALGSSLPHNADADDTREWALWFVQSTAG